MDALINHTLCKHIHLVEKCANGREIPIRERKHIDTNENTTDMLLHALRKNEEPADLHNLKEKILQTLATQVKESNNID